MRKRVQIIVWLTGKPDAIHWMKKWEKHLLLCNFQFWVEPLSHSNSKNPHFQHQYTLATGTKGTKPKINFTESPFGKSFVSEVIRLSSPSCLSFSSKHHRMQHLTHEMLLKTAVWFLLTQLKLYTSQNSGLLCCKVSLSVCAFLGPQGAQPHPTFNFSHCSQLCVAEQQAAYSISTGPISRQP